MGECRDVGLVDESGLAQELVGDGGSCRRSEHGADIDGHVEETESAVSLGCVLRIVVEVSDKDLEVTLEQTCSYGDEGEGSQHQGYSGGIRCRRYRQGEVAQEHDADTCDYAFSETDLVSEDTADDRHEIDRCKENRINLAGHCLIPAELGLEEQHEYGQHGVVTEALAGVCQGECE